MKFKELVFLAEQTSTLPAATQANPVYSIGQQQYRPNQGGTPIPTQDPVADTISNIINGIVNPVQVAIDSYNLGKSIYDSYIQYQNDPSVQNALSLLAVLGVGFISIKTGGAGGEAVERVAKSKMAADAARAQANEAAKLATVTHYLKNMIEILGDPSKVKKISIETGIPEKELTDITKIAIKETDTAIKGAEKAIESTPLKTAYDAALERSKKGEFISTTPAPTAPVPTTQPPATVLPTTTKPGIIRPAAPAPARPGAIKPAAPAPAKPGQPKPTIAPVTTGSSKLRPTTPRERKINTGKLPPETPNQVTKATAAKEAAKKAELLDRMNKIEEMIRNKGVIGKTTMPFRWVAANYNKLDAEEKLGVKSLIAAAMVTVVGGIIDGQIRSRYPNLQQDVMELLNAPVKALRELAISELDKNIKQLNDQKQQLTQKFSNAGWSPEQTKRVIESLDAQIKRAEALKVKGQSLVQ